MTTRQRLEQLLDLRTSMQQRLILLLVKAHHADDPKKEEIESDIEEYKDLLDGIDLLIERLRSRRNNADEKGPFEEWREMDEL
jgi:hypothetical protein